MIDGASVTCCSSLYEHPAVRWLLGGELHPGGAATTGRALELLGARPGDHLLDLACGNGDSALLAGRELGCKVTGIDLSEVSLEEARQAAIKQGVAAHFEHADASRPPFADDRFDCVLMECALSTFSDQPAVIAETRRVTKDGGRLAISDVVVDPDRLPDELRGPIATLACIGGAYDLVGYEQLLAQGGFTVESVESRSKDAAVMAERVEDRLRGAMLIGIEGLDEPLAIVRTARRAIDDGSLDYMIMEVRG